ncbi:unnamed protein product [Amoebophrya sp. A120]|nr:unnamed protein product [Amoebophrya sp. A120]|eukprot:GSA120T00016101001.1
MVYWGDDAGARTSVLQLYSALKARETYQAVVKNAGELVVPDIESLHSPSQTFPLVCSEWYAGGLELRLNVHLFRLPVRARMGKPTQDKSSRRPSDLGSTSVSGEGEARGLIEEEDAVASPNGEGDLTHEEDDSGTHDAPMGAAVRVQIVKATWEHD